MDPELKRALNRALVNACRYLHGNEAYDEAIRLIAMGADVSPDDCDYGRTPLIEAYANRNEPLVRLLLECGPSGEDVMNVVLHDMGRGWHGRFKLDMIVMVVESGVDLNCRSASGWTLIEVAIDSGCLFSVRLLLDNGARLEDRYLFGRRPGMSAGMLKLLLSYGADPEVCRDEDGLPLFEYFVQGDRYGCVDVLLDHQRPFLPDYSDDVLEFYFGEEEGGLQGAGEDPKDGADEGDEDRDDEGAKYRDEIVVDDEDHDDGEGEVDDGEGLQEEEGEDHDDDHGKSEKEDRGDGEEVNIGGEDRAEDVTGNEGHDDGEGDCEVDAAGEDRDDGDEAHDDEAHDDEGGHHDEGDADEVHGEDVADDEGEEDDGDRQGHDAGDADEEVRADGGGEEDRDANNEEDGPHDEVKEAGHHGEGDGGDD